PHRFTLFPYTTLFRSEVLAVQQYAAAIGEVEAGDHAQQRRLAAARGAEQGEKLAGFDADADVVDCGEIAEAAGDVLDFEQRHRVDRKSTRLNSSHLVI